MWQWDADMRSGDLSVRLLRPVRPFHQYATSALGHRLVSLTMLAPALAIAALLVPGLDYPADPVQLACFAVALVLAYGVGLLMASTFALIGL